MNRILTLKHLLALIISLFLQTALFAENNISYIHKDIAVDSIAGPTINWEELKAPIYNGFDNGVYWFKITLAPSDDDRVISIPESHISRAKLYLENEELAKVEKARYVTFRIKAHKEKQLYYLKVNCLLEARIPIEIKMVEEYLAIQTIDYIIMALYYGIAFAVLLFILFSYINLKNKIYLHYLIVCIGMLMTPFYKDGLSALLFGLTGINEVLEAVLSGIVVIGGVYFTASYFKMHKEMPKTWKATIYIIGIAYSCSIIFLITRSVYFFAASHVLLILVLDIFVISAIMLWKKNVYARFFAIAYGLPLIVAHEYFISPYFALPSINLSLNLFKVGSVLEMIIFSYAITLKVKLLIKENDLMRMQLVEYTNNLMVQNKEKNQKLDTISELIEKFNLTLKEIEILKVLALNKTNKEIGELLFISENTVKFHIRNIFKKLDVRCKEDAKSLYLDPCLEEKHQT